MANQEQLEILKAGVEVWNKWRSQKDVIDFKGTKPSLDDFNRWISQNEKLVIDFSEANLSGINLRDANFFQANLRMANLDRSDLRNSSFWDADLRGASLVNANLFGATLLRANLFGADLRGADLGNTNLMLADLREANLWGAKLFGTKLRGANLSGADLRYADLTGAELVRSKIDKAKLSRSSVYAINIWDLQGECAEQNDLIITPKDAPSVITIDNIKVAQFVYLILNNGEIRDVINTLTSKSVLILGRFSIPERKLILDVLKDKLREYNLLPIVFDFDRPTDKDFTETIKTLAGLCYFVIADVTNPKSSPLELQATIPDYQIPFVPIIQEGESPFAMMANLQTKYQWVLPTVTYDSLETLVKVLKPLIIDPAMKKHNELRIIKAQVPQVISGKDYLESGS
jgi:hypothetical protein